MKKLFFSNTSLLVSLFVSMAVAATEAPQWVIAFSAGMIFWKFLNEQFNIPKLAPVLTPLLGISIFLIVYIQNKTVFGQEESTTILFGLTSIAILNYQFERDVLLLVILGFLLLVTKAIFSLDFIWVVPSLFSFFGFWYTLLDDLKINRIRYLLRAILLSLPLFFILFIFFPRFVLFQSSKAARASAQSGFSEDLTPGNFSTLVLQNDLVFRAEFSPDFNPKIESLYWRGAVLDISNGFMWQKGKPDKAVLAPDSKSSRGEIFYITQEPLSLKNIFVPETTLALNPNAVSILKSSSGIFSLASIQPSAFQFSGEISSALIEVSAEELKDLRTYLKHPQLSEKTKTWVDRTKQKLSDPDSRLKALENFFSNSGFIYTLSPGNYKNNLDDFLFSRKRGFCEHFAAAFATMARALEVPARVVIGYQGGSYNSVGRFWKISQKDAHAWVEVLRAGLWQRTDPTALVSPLRMALGGEAYFALSEDEQILYSKNTSWKESNFSFALWNQTSHFFENLNYHWTLFLLDYDLQAQLQFLKTLSFFRVTTFILLTAGIIIIIFSYSRRRRKYVGKTAHPLSQLFSKMEFWAGEQKMELDESMTPLQILNLMALQFPQIKSFLSEFSLEYTTVMYQSHQLTKTFKFWDKKWTEAKSKASSK